MLMLRIAGFVVVITLGTCFVLYLMKRDRRYLRLAGQILRYSVILAAIVMAFYVLERLVLVV
ncbi:MAG: hypothetical protein U1F52_02875 [Burkholderiales bacterium]